MRPTNHTLVYFKTSSEFCVMKKSIRQVKKEKWFAIVADYLAKGISQIEFCTNSGIKKATFVYWLRKYRSKSEHSKQGGFVALKEPKVSSFNFGNDEVTLRRGEVELLFSTLPSLEKLIPLIKALS